MKEMIYCNAMEYIEDGFSSIRIRVLVPNLDFYKSIILEDNFGSEMRIDAVKKSE